ncbi:bifunctional phosphoglucose/phosphomannose isomerase [soil metagenome]
MLDDLKYIHEKDAQDALGVAEKQWQQLQHDFSGVELSGLNYDKVQNIIVAGMGGSALAATLLSGWPKLNKPFEVVRQYTLPASAGAETLFIASSYSGNTEETLEALHQAESRKCQIVVIAAGGALEARAAEKEYPYFKIPGGLQPRMAVFYNFAALVQLLEPSGFIGTKKIHELRETADWLGEETKAFLPTVPSSDNKAKQIALECMGKSPVIYAGPELFPAAYKWKINFNENSKNVAWCGQYPEFNHNEFLGWTSHPTHKPYAVIDLRSSLEHKRVQKRFEVTERLLSGKRPAPEIIEVQGETPLKQLLWAVCLGDFVSLYLALLNGLNPTPVDLIEKFKKALDE